MKIKTMVFLLSLLLVPLMSGFNVAKAYVAVGRAHYDRQPYHGYYHGNRGYYWNGQRYNYYHNGRYYNYYNNGAYYIYYSNGRYYNRCTVTPGYRAHGVWYPAVRRCW